MENASDGCVITPDDGAELSKPATDVDDSKLKHVSPYVNKPIFKRKLIEKYSTARYNINTKRVLVKKPAASQPPCTDKAPKVSVKNVSPSRVENDKKRKSGRVRSFGSSNDDVVLAKPRTRRSVRDKSCSKKCQSNVKSEGIEASETTINDETTVDGKIPSSCSVAASNKQHDARLSRKRKCSSGLSPPPLGSKTAWKIAPRIVYNQLWDLYQNTVEIKTEEPEPEPKKETKKRNKCQWTKKRSRRKAICVSKKVPNETAFDPYVECLKEAETQQSNSASAGQNGDKLGFVMYLGVNRPLFPLVYRNLCVLNDSKDATITDFWSEFALSTLVTKKEDMKYKPILVPVKDSELHAMVSECVAKIIPSNVSGVSSAQTASEDDTVKSEIFPQIDVKQEENQVPPKKRSKYKPSKKPKTYKSRVKSEKRSVKKEDKSRVKFEKRSVKKEEPEECYETKPMPTLTPMPTTPTRDQTKPSPLLTPIPTTPIRCQTKLTPTPPRDQTKPSPLLTPIPTTPTHQITPPPMSTTPIRHRTPSPDLLPPVLSPNPVFVPSSSTTPPPPSTPPPPIITGRSPSPNLNAGAKACRDSDSKPKIRGIRSKAQPLPDEKAILKKFGYKECQVAIPKLSDTLIKYLSAGNYSNESAQLSDPTERELIEETDDFGLIQCTRTDGIIIDYTKRNRSLVYYYKLKKMLDFQKTNNKYFVCCDYMLIDRSNTGDADVDITSIEEDDGGDEDDNSENDKTAQVASGPRHSRNPNDLFKSSKISEFKSKSYTISWVKNHDLRAITDVKWLLISLDKHIATLSHANVYVLRYRLLFEIIYRAELSKKVICCEIPKASASGSVDHRDTDSVGEKLAFGVYAFPGLCDKVLAGPYLYHEEHRISAGVRTSFGGSEPVRIRTLEEKENFPQTDDSTPVKHINAKWWSGQLTNGDLTEQYLNFFFNPSYVKCVLSTDKIHPSKILEDHPCHNYHSYQVTGRESNMVLFHDRTNAIEKTIVTSTEPTAAVETDIKSEPATKDPAPTMPSKPLRNLRKKPRRDYSQLVTDDMAVPARTKNLEFHIVDVKSLKRRPARGEFKPKRNRYHESPQTHIMNERMRRLEFRNRRNDLASVLDARPSGSNSTQSLVSILIQAREIINYLEIDNSKLDEEGKRLRIEQSMMMRRFLALLRSLDIKSMAYKKGMTFVAAWKQIKSEHRNKLIDILGQNFDKQKAIKVAEVARNSHTGPKKPTSAQRQNGRRPIRRPVLTTRKSTPDEETTSSYSYTPERYRRNYREHDSEHSKAEDAAHRLKSRKMKRQKMRNELRKRNHQVEKVPTESVECAISEEVVCVDGKLSDPFCSSHILEKLDEIPIIIPNMVRNVDPYAVDPLADEDYSSGASSPPGGYSAWGGKEPSHPLLFEHSYCSLEDEPPGNSSKMFDKRIPQIRTIRANRPASASLTTGSRYRPVRPIVNSYRPPLLSSTTTMYYNGYRPNRPNLSNPTALLRQRKNAARARTQAGSMVSPAFQIRVNKSAEESLGIDILDNGRMFARLNIAKVNNGNDTNNAPSSSSVGGAAGASTSNKIMSIIQRFLMQMEKTSLPNAANDDERAKQARRKHVVNSLKTFISKFENRRKPDENATPSSSRAPYSNNTSPSNVTDSIELESGYSSKSEESCDRDYDSNTKEQPIDRDRHVDGQAIENIVLDDDDDEDEEEEEEEEEKRKKQDKNSRELEESKVQEVEEEQVLPEDEFIEEEEEEIIGQEELIEEEEEEEEIVGYSNTLEEIDAAMRGDDDDRFVNSDDSAENDESEEDDGANIDLVQDSDNYRSDDEQETFTLPQPTPKTLYTTNRFTIIKSKDKFIPNIMKTPTKTVLRTTSASDHPSRIQIKPSIGPLVKMSTTAVLRPATNGPPQIPSSGNNVSIIKRLWYSPVTKPEQADLKILRRDSPSNESVKVGSPQSVKSVDAHESQSNGEEGNSNDQTESNSEKNNNGAKRILIKSFANHEKFQEAFLSNVDKLLNPEL